MLKMPCLLELVENFPVEHFSVGKCWFYRIETFHRNMLIPLKVSIESRQAVQEACSPGCVPAGAPLAPLSPGSCSSSFLTPQPGLWSGTAVGRETWNRRALAGMFLWKFSFLYKNMNSSGKITKHSFSQDRNYIFYQCGHIAKLCSVFDCTSHIYNYYLRWKVSLIFTLK